MQDRITNFELVKYINKQFSKAAIVFFCTVHAACLCLTAQLTAIDSLLRALKTSQQDSAKIMLNYKLAEQLNQYDRTTADRYLEAGYSMAKASRHIYYIAYFFKIKGGLLFDRGKYNDSGLYFDSAIVSYSELIQAAKQDAKKKEACLYYKTDCLIGKGLIAAKLYNYQQSIQCYLDAITSIENIEGNKKNDYLATLYADIASNYYELEQFDPNLGSSPCSCPCSRKCSCLCFSL